MSRLQQPLALDDASDGAVAGVDEAGRGPLAGPVVVAAVVLDPNRVPAGLDDSKRLTAARRLQLAEEVRATALAWQIELRTAAEIDRANILACTLDAMAAAVTVLEVAVAEVRVDGNRLPPVGLRRAARWRAMVGGDGLDASIAAASILAKTHRDALMCDLDARWPVYGFAQHKGYPTARHLEALRAHGPCPVHRRSYAPVRAVAEAG